MKKANPKRMAARAVSGLIFYGGKVLGTKPGQVRILCYHRVRPEAKHYIEVSFENFEAQMAYLSTIGYQTIGLDDLLAGRADEKSIIITFDDGYRDNFEHVFPCMSKYGFKGIIFCVSGLIGKPDYLTPDQLSVLIEAGFTIGAHTVHHINLATAGREAKWQEIRGSKQMLSDLTRSDIRYFCYPYGAYDKQALAMVEEAGFEAACSNRPGANRPGEVVRRERFMLKRTEIGVSDTLADFERKLVGSYDLIHQALHMVRGRS